MPSLIAGTVLCWARALGEFGATITFAGNLQGTTQTLPLFVYIKLEGSNPDAAIVLSLVLLGVSLAVLIGLARPLAHVAVTLTAHVHVELDGFTLDADLSIEAGRTVAVVGPNGAGKTTLLNAWLACGPSPPVASSSTEPCSTIPSGAPTCRPSGGRSASCSKTTCCSRTSTRSTTSPSACAPAAPPCRGRSQAAAWLARARRARRPRTGSPEPSCPAGRPSASRWPARSRRNPALLLLDEPLAALDATTRNEVRRDLRRHLATFPGVRLLITHDPVDAAVLADHVIVLDNGRVAQTGTPAEITAPTAHPLGRRARRHQPFHRHRHRRRSRHARSRRHARQRRPPHTRARVRRRAPARRRVHRERPEGSARNTWPGRLTAVEPVGDRFRLQIDADPPVVAEVTGAAVHDIGLTDGVEVWVAVKATEIDVYPA